MKLKSRKNEVENEVKRVKNEVSKWSKKWNKRVKNEVKKWNKIWS